MKTRLVKIGAEGKTNLINQEFVILFSFSQDKICLCAGRRDLRVPGEHRAQDEQAAGAGGGGAQGRLTPVYTNDAQLNI